VPIDLQGIDGSQELREVPFLRILGNFFQSSKWQHLNDLFYFPWENAVGLGDRSTGSRGRATHANINQQNFDAHEKTGR
jgi:hypothetical protein